MIVLIIQNGIYLIVFKGEIIVNTTKPDMKGLDQLDTAVLLQKMIVINGMINYGTKEQKEKGKMEFKKLEPLILNSVNLAALEQAKFELNITNNDLKHQ